MVLDLTVCTQHHSAAGVCHDAHASLTLLPLDAQVLEQKDDIRGALKRMAATSNKLGLDGGLPETMPAGMLMTPYMQSLHQALLPFQVVATSIRSAAGPTCCDARATTP